MTSKTEAIRALNDEFRQNLSTDIGSAVITTGVAALGDDAVARIVKTIGVYNDWCADDAVIALRLVLQLEQVPCLPQ
jgi:hypothetical protein